jgi:uncharacterized protein YneF (UPF0154 family)
MDISIRPLRQAAKDYVHSHHLFVLFVAILVIQAVILGVFVWREQIFTELGNLSENAVRFTSRGPQHSGLVVQSKGVNTVVVADNETGSISTISCKELESWYQKSCSEVEHGEEL